MPIFARSCVDGFVTGSAGSSDSHVWSTRRQRTSSRSARSDRVAGLNPTPSDDHAFGHLRSRQRVRDVVSPAAVDMKVRNAQALFAETELLRDPPARGVLWTNVHLDTMQSDRLEAVVYCERQGRGDDASAGHALVHPVTDMGRAQ